MNINNFKKYFYRRSPSGSFFLLLIGIMILMICSFIEKAFLWKLIGGAICALAIWGIYNFKTKHSDKNVDDYCLNKASEFYENRKNFLLSQNKTIVDSICSSGYCFDNYFSARTAICGKDKKTRSTLYDMSCLLFTTDSVYYYNKIISLITDEKLEMQKDFHTQDIQMVSLEQNNQAFFVFITIPGNEKIRINCKSLDEASRLCERIKSLRN